MTIAIYMLHAIGQIEKGDWADPHYCISKESYKLFLSSVKQVLSLDEVSINKVANAVVFTFDDGHVSNYWAGKYIAENGYGSAEFYINPDHIGKDYYMTWAQVLELSNLGMSIQSHGLDHRYLSDLTDIELEYQLLESKSIIESHVNKPVTRLSPPGGRYDSRCLSLAKQLGYKFILNSEPGAVRKLDHFLLPRIAVKKGSDVMSLIAMSKRTSLKLIFSIIRYKILSMAKIILGDSRYERIRWYLLGVLN